MQHNYATLILKIGGVCMPTILPIRDMRDTSAISELAHKQKEPIFITKNGYSDLVIMSAELYEHFAANNRIDQAQWRQPKEVGVFALAADVLTTGVRIIESAIKRFTFTVALKY
jgi:hypothetical protein